MARGGARSFGARDQHRHVEMVVEQLGGFDRALVAAVDQDDAFARQAHQREIRHRLGGGGEQRRHLRPGRRALARPAGGLADVDESERGRLSPSAATSENSGASWVQPTISGAPRAAAARNSLELGAAEVARGRDVPPQPRRTASASSGIVSSHEQSRICSRSFSGHRISPFVTRLRACEARRLEVGQLRATAILRDARFRKLTGQDRPDLHPLSHIYSYSKQKVARSSLETLRAETRPAAAVHAGHAARGGRRVRACDRARADARAPER